MIYPKTAFALPSVDGIKMDWVIPPSESRRMEKWVFDSTTTAHFRFDVDPRGAPWFVDGHDRLLLDFLVMEGNIIPMRTESRFDDGVFLDGGVHPFCAGRRLAFLHVEDKGQRTLENGLVQVQFKPFLNLPDGDCRLFSGGQRTIYVVLHKGAGGGDDIFLLRSDPRRPRKLEKILSASEPITALAGDGDKTYYAAGREIYELSRGETKAKPFYSADEPVTGLAYSAAAGVFYATTSHVGFASPAFQMNFLTSPDPEIALRGDAVYVRLSQKLAVLKISGARKFKSLARAGKAAP
ncbi:MAG: hypothetical protein KGL74_05590 [Elusimicrobia bacterium]|nr:hypothetical protein [Elusimicrobiota bacterium]